MVSSNHFANSCFYKNKNNFVHRFTPRYMYNRQQYPNYLSGSGYVFTIDTAKKLYNASMEMPLLYLEDVYTTGKFFISIDFIKSMNLYEIFVQIIF